MMANILEFLSNMQRNQLKLRVSKISENNYYIIFINQTIIINYDIDNQILLIKLEDVNSDLDLKNKSLEFNKRFNSAIDNYLNTNGRLFFTDFNQKYFLNIKEINSIKDK